MLDVVDVFQHEDADQRLADKSQSDTARQSLPYADDQDTLEQ